MVAATRTSPFVASGGAQFGLPLRASVCRLSVTPSHERRVVTVPPFGRREYVPGDVTSEATGRIAVHRVVTCLPQGWLVRGDDCRKTDGVLARDAFVSHVARVERNGRDQLPHCRASCGSFTVGQDVTIRICSALWPPGTVQSVRPGGPGIVNVRETWARRILHARDLRGRGPHLREKCRSCVLIRLFLWRPLHSALVTGEMDACVECCCEMRCVGAAALQDEDQA